MSTPAIGIGPQESSRSSETSSKGGDSLLEAQLKSIAQRVKSNSPAEQAKAKQDLAALRQRPEFQNPATQHMMDQAEKGQEPQRDSGQSDKTQHPTQAQDFSGPSTETLGRFQTSDLGPNWQEKSGFFSSRNPADNLASKTQSRPDSGRDTQRTSTGTNNPNQWSVANSSKSSPQLRQFLNESNAGQRPSDFLLNTMSFKMPEAMPQLPHSGFAAQPDATGAFANLFKTLSFSGGETAAKAFTGRNFEGAPLLKVFENLSPEQQVAQQLSQRPPIVVDVRNNFVFIKTKDGFHALKLEDDILHELPLEDESGKPLSPEEKKMILKILKGKGIDAKFAGEEEILTMLGEADLAAGFEKFLLQKKGVGGKISKEDLFCLLLDAVLKGKLKLGTAGLEGDPLFPGKEDWLAFFANLGGLLGNKPLSLSKPLEDILGLIFRGLFSKDGKNILVGDLKFLSAGEGEEAKMIQAEISEEALKMLENLLPGKTLDKAALEKLFGKELRFTELMHQDAGKNNVPQTTLSGHANFEKSVLALRKEIPAEEPKTELNIPLEGFGASPQNAGDQTVPANVYELLGLRKLYEGHPRLYSWILYLTAGSIAMITLFFIILNLL